MIDAIYNLDCFEALGKSSLEGKIDAIVCDPPYNLSFMGRKWDQLGEPREFQVWCRSWGDLAWLALKPGAFLLAFGGTRTYHRLASGLEDAGFEIRDTITWLQGQGFPKNRGLLKPSSEPIVLARKPLEGTVRDNVSAYGTGELQIDAARIEGAPRPLRESLGQDTEGKNTYGSGGPGGGSRAIGETDLGRWPANVVLSHNEGCRQMGVRVIPGRQIRRPVDGMLPFGGGRGKEYIAHFFPEEMEPIMECVPGCPVDTLGEGAKFYYCAKVSVSERNAGCEALEPQFAPSMNPGIGGIGGSKLHSPICSCEVFEPRETSSLDGAKRCRTCGGVRAEDAVSYKLNTHPTVKPIDLMRWLVRLVTPPEGTVLDPFMGSGSTGIACVLEDRDFIGMEIDADSFNIARLRLDFWKRYGEDGLRIVALRDMKPRVSEQQQEQMKEVGQTTIFDVL